MSAGRTMDQRNEESSINTDAEVEREQPPMMLQSDTASQDAKSVSQASCKLKLFEETAEDFCKVARQERMRFLIHELYLEVKEHRLRKERETKEGGNQGRRM
ncbi:hypothetical protein B0H14DRAFT_2631591 [Mycena olivaceomarginata]|nr:hypothetical protein B0H14DRAFT_2631591 [Mycena olivaceomarginata]